MAQGGVFRRKGDGEKAVRASNWRVRYPDHTGRMVDRTIPNSATLSKPEAEAIRARWAAEALLYRTGVKVQADHVTLHDFWTREYWPELEAGKVAESTAVLKARQYKHHIRPHWGHLPLSQCDERAAAAFKLLTAKRAHAGKKKGAPLDATTIHGVDRTLSAILHHAARLGYYGPEAAEQERRGKWVKPYTSPGAPSGEVERPTLETLADAAAVISAARTVPDSALDGLMFATAVMLAIVTGQRRGEQPGQLVADVKPDGEGFRVITRASKTSKNRVHHVAGGPALLLRAWLETRAAFLAAAGVESVYLFPHLRTARHRGRVAHHVGARRDGYVISDGWWSTLRERAELDPSFRVHDLRGVFAKTLNKYVTPGELATLMDHADLKTQRRYTKTAPGALQREAGEVFAGMELDVPDVPDAADELSPYDRPELSTADLLALLEQRGVTINTNES